MKKCALLTCKDMSSFVTDEPLLEKALNKAGWKTQWTVWNEKQDWNQFDAAIVRTTWDYFRDIDKFLEVIDDIEGSRCQLLNPAEVMRWNADKIYMMDLQKQGVDIVPTAWGENLTPESIHKCFQDFQCEKIVCKPTIGAGAVDTFVLRLEQDDQWQQAMDISSKKFMMLQPFMENIQEEGEYSLHFFNKIYSHSILKKPKTGDFRSQEEYGSHIVPVKPSAQLLQTAEKVLAKINEDLLYARVDLIRDSNDKFKLMELELIEPALYFRYDEGSPSRFVGQLQKLIKG